MDANDNDRESIVGDFKHGSIRRIALKNFLTYSNVEINPGPRLNMVVGPNGTGKSTILCAICLGLGGEPKLLGRASEIETFVMNGEDEGRIEIELADEKDPDNNPVIARIIRREGSPKSTFLLNGNHISAKELRKMVQDEYHVSVDNLCTFLPQDRVGSFSAFGPKDLLIETEKSVSPLLYETHQELIQAQTELASGSSNVDTLREKLQQLEAENARLEREKARMEERQLALEQADLLRKKLVWLKFDDTRVQCCQLRDNQKEAKKALQQAQAELAPLETQHMELEEQKNELETRYQTLDKQTKKFINELQKQVEKNEKHDDCLEEALSRLREMESLRARKEQEVEQHKSRVNELEVTLSEFPNIEEVENNYNELKTEREALRTPYNEVRYQLRQQEEHLREVQDNARLAESKLNKLNDDQARRIERIFRQQAKLKQVYDWVQENRANFRRPVLGPVMCEISTKSNNAAAYLEFHVPTATLKSFIVEDKSDYDYLYNNVRGRLKLPVNIILVRPRERRERIYSDDKMAMLQQEHGILGYMDESFTAPEAVMQALIAKASVDRVLVGNEKTQHSIDDRGLLNILTEPKPGATKLQSCCIFSCRGNRSFRYQTTVSRYNGKTSTRVDDVRPPKFLAPGVQEEVKQLAADELNKLRADISELRPKTETTRAKCDELQREAQVVSEALKDAKKKVEDLRKLQNKLINAKRRLMEAQELLEVDDEVEKRRIAKELENRFLASMSSIEAHSLCHQKMIDATLKAAGVRIHKESIVAEERRIKQLKSSLEAEFQKREQEYKSLHQQFSAARSELNKIKTEAEELAPIHDEDGNELPLKALLESLPVDSMEEAEAALEESEAKANSIDANADVVRQYEERKLQIEEVQAQLDDLSSSKGVKERELEQKLRPWENAISNSVREVNKLFSVYMKELGCTGEVCLTKGEEVEGSEHGNFKDWGIEIRVSFREGVKAQVLSARVQSGGERSVSTIMFLMALQERMVAPFRCVDEINQGLDDRNERLVFRRIVQNSTSPPKNGPTDHCGQYFLITPKLLPNLYDMEEEALTVLFIFNGPYNFKSPSEWDVSRLIELRTKRPIEDDDGDNDNDKAPVPKKAKRET